MVECCQQVSAEGFPIIPAVPAAAAVLLLPTTCALTGAATLPGIAVPSSIARPAPTPIPLSSPTQEIPSASAPQLPGTVAELVAAANADMGDEDAIALGQMQVFSRVEHLLNLENDKKHDPLDALVKFTGLMLYQAMEIRKQYLKLMP